MDRLPEPMNLADRLAEWGFGVPADSGWTVTADWEPDPRTPLAYYAPDTFTEAQVAAHEAGEWTLMIATVSVMDGDTRVYFCAEDALRPEDAVSERTLRGLAAQAIAGAVNPDRI